MVTMKMCRTQGACLSIDRNEYRSSSLSSKRLAETSSSCLDYKKKKNPFLDLKQSTEVLIQLGKVSVLWHMGA